MMDQVSLDIKKILKEAKNIAIVGASDKPHRDSYHVMEFLMDAGYNVIPVNPAYNEIFGRKCYPDLRQIDENIDIVDVFRRSEELFPIVQDAMMIGAKTIWMQLGVINEGAAALARKAGLNVIMNRCIKIEYINLIR
jgi:Predicted CoA-binding protein